MKKLKLQKDGELPMVDINNEEGEKMVDNQPEIQNHRRVQFEDQYAKKYLEAMLHFKKRWQQAGVYLYQCPFCMSDTLLHLEACHICTTPNEYRDLSLSNLPYIETELILSELAIIQNKSPK